VSFAPRAHRAIASIGTVALIMSAAPGAAARPDRARIDPAIFLATGRTSVLVHVATGTTMSAGVLAARAAGLDPGTTYEPIGVFVAYGGHEQIRALSGDPAISYIEANLPLEQFTDTAHYATRTEEVLSGAFKLRSEPIDGSGVGVAVVDSGVDGTHPDLVSRMGGNVKIVCSVPVGGVASAATPFSECRGPKHPVPMDDTDSPSLGGHGTHVAGIVAGTGEFSDGRFHGAAPGATLYGISVGTMLTVENALDGLAWVLDNHDDVVPPIKVVNNSWGSAYAEYDPQNATFHKATWLLQEALIAEGVSVVAAAGNSYGTGFEPTTVAECINPTPGVVCVANYSDDNTGTRDGSIHGSSSRGRWFSPETWPDVAAPGTSITSTCRATLPVCTMLDESGGANENYATLTGTSMAAPNVAGIIALLYQANPSLSPAEVEDLLEDTAYKFEWGSEYGLFVDETNPENSSSYEKGHGLVDALDALRAVRTPGDRPGPSTFPRSSPQIPTYRPEFPGFVAHWNFTSVTEREFTTTCPPTISAGGEDFYMLTTQGVDAHVFEIPEQLREVPLRARIGGSNPIPFYDVGAVFYDASCTRTGASATGGDEDVMVPAGTRYIVVTPGLLAYATFIYLELYDLSS
jgi:serine protease AprX